MKQTNFVKMAMIVALLLLSLTLLTPTNAGVIPSSIIAQPVSSTDYGDIMQYECVAGENNQNQDGCSAGPGPDVPNVLWKVTASGSGYISVFNGKAFVISGATLRAYDAFTGDLVWNTTLTRSASGTGGTKKIDDTYLFVDCNGPEVHRISDGSFVANYTIPYYGGQGGGAQYFPGSWSSTLKMKYAVSFDNVDTKKGYINAISLADPTHPVLAWQYVCHDASEISTYGDGILLVGTSAGVAVALNGTTGEFLWRAPKTGMVQQHGLFYDGNFYESASSATVTCWNTSGAVQWEYDLNNLCTRAFGVYNGAAGYGRYYCDVDGVEPNSWVACWDAKTGDLMWKQPAYYNIAYNTPVLGGGKLYTVSCDRAADSQTAGLVMPGYRFTCFDAYTGTELWSIPQAFATPSIAYGNLYGAYGGVIYCIGTSTPNGKTVSDWNYGFSGGNLSLQRVALAQAGPQDLTTPRWVFATGGKITSSAAVVDGKVYVGSDDHNWYCLDAYTGAKIWNFTTDYLVQSSAAVVNGRVYTGADDGNIYCLNANTGALIWKTPAGGLIDYIIMPQFLQSRSCPIIVNNLLYVGSLDGKVYCLNTGDGSVKWTYKTGDAIGGSPAYYNGAIYIASTDTYLYALDATTGALKFKTIGLNLDVFWNSSNAMTNLNYFNTPTPVIANGVIYVAGGVTMGGRSASMPANAGGAYGGGMRIAAFNATTGASIWNQTLGGNSGSVWIPTYYNGNLYMVEFMQVTCMNASAPGTGTAKAASFAGLPADNRTWAQWIGYEILSSVAYVDDLRGPTVYVGSDVGSITCLNAITGKPISTYQTGANVEASPSIWEGKLYIGGVDRNIYCFDDSPIVDFNIFADSNKGSTMWNNESLTISGRLTSNPDEITYDDSAKVWIPVTSEMHPGLPNANITISFTKPDATSENVTCVTDNLGYFTVTKNLAELGTWGWVAYYEGLRQVGLSYNEVYGQWNQIDVEAAPVNSIQTQTATPSSTIMQTEAPTTPAVSVTLVPSASPAVSSSTLFGGMPVEYLYAIVAVVVIIIVAVAAYAYLKSKKKA
jgi:outer membrane protein assembly factor BamB